MKLFQKNSFVVLAIFFLFLSIGEKPVLAYQNKDSISIPLKNLVVSSDEIMNAWGYHSNTPIRQYDVSYELADICFVDCVKITWAGESNKDISTKTTLIMIRSRNSENAMRSIQNLWQTYSNKGESFFAYDDFKENDNFWLGYMGYSGGRKLQHIAVRTQGTVTIMVFYDFIIHTFVPDVDVWSNIEYANKLSNIQQQKLAEAGY